MKRKQKALLNFSIVFFMLLMTVAFPSMRACLNKTMNRKLIEKVNNHALSANIKIVQLKHKSEENSSSTSISPGASGVVFRREGNRYYALTAKHVIDEVDNIDKTQIAVLGYDDLDFNDYIKRGGVFQGVAEYYKKFPEAVVEYSNEKYDLAVISFTSDKAYTVLPISDAAPKYGDTVAAMGNPNGKSNIITSGKIISRKPSPFGDEAGKMQYPIIKHTAELSEGSSGSALLNKDLEIVGINLGGNENILRQHISGMAMPSNSIIDFLEEWENKRI